MLHRDRQIVQEQGLTAQDRAGAQGQVNLAAQDLGRLSGTIANGDATLYAYTAAGNLYSLTDAEQNTTTWTYDLLGRAVAETTAAGTCSCSSARRSARAASAASGLEDHFRS